MYIPTRRRDPSRYPLGSDHPCPLPSPPPPHPGPGTGTTAGGTVAAATPHRHPRSGTLSHGKVIGPSVCHVVLECYWYFQQCCCQCFSLCYLILTSFHSFPIGFSLGVTFFLAFLTIYLLVFSVVLLFSIDVFVICKLFRFYTKYGWTTDAY